MKVEIIETHCEIMNEMYPDQTVSWNTEDGFQASMIACHSSIIFNGTCQCHSHNPIEYWEISAEEFFLAYQKAGESVSDLPDEIWEAPETALHIDNPIGIDLDWLSDWIESSYELDFNPLPHLRKTYPWIEWAFGYDSGNVFFPAPALTERPIIAVWLSNDGYVRLEVIEPE